jgi:hypothetical protein
LTLVPLFASAHAHNFSGRLLRRTNPGLFAGATRARMFATASAAAPQLQAVLDLAMQGDLPGTAAAMDGITADQLAIGTEGLEYGGAVGYHHIFSNDALSMGIFVLPAGSVIPLHDHPSMNVLSKLLFGKLRVTAFDRPASEEQPTSKLRTLFGRTEAAGTLLRCASPTRRTITAPCPTLRLDPIHGNIHEFEAVEHTAIFDVLTPPYDDRAGRSCHYFTATTDASSEDGYALKEIGWPASLRVVNRLYRGPSVRHL